MRTPSIRTLHAIAYESGEEFDPALLVSPAQAEWLDNGAPEGTTVFALPLADEGRCEGVIIC